MTSATPEKKKKHGFFGRSKKDKEPSPPPVIQAQSNVSSQNQDHAPNPDRNQNHSANPSLNPSNNTGNAPDSAYGGSDGPSSMKRNSSNNIVPLENHLDGANHDRNFTLNKNTGEVLDDDTGEVVTTTTTTTTTTTILKNGKKGTTVEVSTQNDGGQPQIAEAPGDGPPGSNMRRSHSPVPPPMSSGAPASNATSHTGPSRDNHGINFSSHAPPPPLNNPSSSAYPPPPGQPPDQFPTPPLRNLNRKSGEYVEHTPISPMRPNFSYPSRPDLREEAIPASMPAPAPTQSHPANLMPGQTPAPAQTSVHPAMRNEPRPQSTFENLKSAAVGLHGVGETLRGTINNEVDQRFPRSNADKAERANMKNRSVLDAGRHEINRISERRSQESSGVPPAYAAQPHSSPPQPPPQQANGFQREPRLPPSNEMQQVTPSFSPESNGVGDAEQKKGGLFGRKLMKRKPVG